MTRSAPRERTNSTFFVLQTPVTLAPNDFAICTAKVPIPPAAPLIKTFCPALRCPLSRSPCNAVSPAIGTAAAWSKLTLSGFRTNLASEAQAYSAKAPLQAPNTASPGLNCVTVPPTAATSPATSTPGRWLFMRQSSGLTEAARTRMTTSLSFGTGCSRSFISRTFPDLALV